MYPTILFQKDFITKGIMIESRIMIPIKGQRSKQRVLIINKTGKKIYFPKGMEKKYCSDFLDAGEHCRHGDKCNFVHAVFPGGFTDKDKSLMENFIENESGLSLNQYARVANKHVSATTPK